MTQENKVVDQEVLETEQPIEEAPQAQVKTFSQDEVNRIVQERLAKEKEKNEKAQEEAKRLAKLSADERAKEEVRIKEEALAKREEEITKRELTAEAKTILADKGLPASLSDLLNYESAESVQDSITVLESAIQKATEAAVTERLKGNAPKVQTGTSKMSREEILKISNPIERKKKIAENIELFN